MNNRRDFLADVGRGMLVASVGPAVAADLGLSRAFAEEGTDKLNLGKFECSPLSCKTRQPPS